MPGGAIRMMVHRSFSQVVSLKLQRICVPARPKHPKVLELAKDAIIGTVVVAVHPVRFERVAH